MSASRMMALNTELIERELLRLILNFLRDKNYTKTTHLLEKESKYFFDLRHFENAITEGDYDAAERYLSGFTSMSEDSVSAKLFCLLWSSKFTEAHLRGDYSSALEILNRDLKAFPRPYRQLVNTLGRPTIDCRNMESMRRGRAFTIRRLRNLIQTHPHIKHILRNPRCERSRMLNLVCTSPEFIWKRTDYTQPFQLCSLRLPDETLASKIMKLMYTSSGSALLALSSKGVHKLWKWQLDQSVIGEEASTNVKPKLWTPSSGYSMTNETAQENPEGAVPCFDLSENNNYVVSASGGKICLYNMLTFKKMCTFKTPPPAATSVAFHPKDHNVIAIGMDDSTIHIYNAQSNELVSKLEGHQKRITGLAFSKVLDILVSSGSDTLLCVWGISTWEKRTSTFLPMIAVRGTSSSNTDTKVQLDRDQLSVLAVHGTQVAVCEATELKIMRLWSPPPHAMITDATYACDDKSIYVCLKDGRVAVLLSDTMMVRCIINPSAYLRSAQLYSDHRRRVVPVVQAAVAIAAHPSEPNRFAIGLSDGGVHVVEPLASEKQWRTLCIADT